MFLRDDVRLDHGSGAGALSFGRLSVAEPAPTFADKVRDRFPDFDIVPDLGSNIGSRDWWRGAATCFGLCAVTLLLSPGISRPILAGSAPPLSGEDWDAARSQSISALALGATTGKRMAAGALVKPLAETPERPIIEATVLVGDGDDLSDVLTRAGASNADARAAAAMIEHAIGGSDLKTGTRVAATLGRRAAKSQPRPLEKVELRARFDLQVELVRTAAGFTVNRIPIAIDHTPLRIEGLVGSSLYRSARAAGAPARAVEAYIKAIASRVPMADVNADDRFDIIIEQQRAKTGEVKLGDVLYAGLDHDGQDVGLLRWQSGGDTEWYDRKGVGETKGMLAMPVQGRITSTFGMRMHPLLHYMRMHDGIDIANRYGTPLHAAADGTVVFAGRAGGYGNLVKIQHRSGYSTRYGHMSRFAVHVGEHVSQGEVIGLMGSSGESTGPHVHFEVRINDKPINPLSVSFTSTARLSGGELAKFRALLSQLLAAPSASRQEVADTGLN